MISKNCQNCGSSFSVVPSRKDTARFCSKECHYNSKRELRTCENCGCDFKVKKHRKDKFCSQNCYYKHKKNGVTKSCVICGKDFYVCQSEKYIKCCSIECGNIHKKNGEYRECKVCKNKFYTSFSNDKKYCSHKCYSSDIEIYPNTSKLRLKVLSKKYQRDDREELNDNYIKSIIGTNHGLSFKNIPKELVELKRLNIKRKRIIRNQKQK